MADFNADLGKAQATWRIDHIVDQRAGTQNGHTRSWILPAAIWADGLFPAIRDSLPAYLDDPLAKVEKHKGAHNLKSSWMLCANLFFPFREGEGRALLAEFLRKHVSDAVDTVERVELEYAEAAPLDPVSLLGEPVGGTRGANQTSPDVAFVVRTSSGACGLILTENKLTEHFFYACSGRKAEVSNPDRKRCLDWPKVQDDPAEQCWQMKWQDGHRTNRRYWEYIRLTDLGKRTFTQCPAATAGYQLFRQHALAEALAESGKYELVASCVAYDDRNTALIESLRSTGVNNFAKDWGALFAGSAIFKTWTHQEWVGWVRRHGGARWTEWVTYMETRYDYREPSS